MGLDELPPSWDPVRTPKFGRDLALRFRFCGLICSLIALVLVLKWIHED